MDPKEFGQRVYKLRMDKGWSQGICADRSGISVRTLQMIESYNVSPTIETTEKLLAAFQCTWADLLGSPASVITAAAMPPLPKKKR